MSNRVYWRENSNGCRQPFSQPRCPYCNKKTVSRKKEINRKDRWQCSSCKKSFSVTVKTIFHHTHVDLQKWFLLISLVLNAKKGLSACQAARDLDMRRPTVWSMKHRIRKAMKTDSNFLSGIVEMDETYIGGKPRKKKDDNDKPNKRGRGTKKKAVVGMLERGGDIKATSLLESLNGNKKYEELRKLISNKSINEESKKAVEFIELQKINKEAARKLFLACHKYIWNTEKRGPLSAFTEFIKLIFVKLLNDKILHEDYTMIDKTIKVPVFANMFSVKWIESREKEISNPINNISFKNLLNIIQDDIDKNNKKTIFDINEEINLKPTTIKGVAKKLERIDLFGIDEDLNGRLFETFLNATMRGKALGQYFTPRSIVLLGTYLANLQISDKHIDKVIDASCGSGGFLIEALAIMRNKVRTNNFYSKEKKEKLINDLCSNYLFGIDAATDPNLAKIARINMYLHGDGGSHIYFYDGLEKDPVIDKNDSRLIQKETTDLINNIKNEAFDVILTNPPFSMWYEETNELQNKILEKYELINFDIKKTNKTRNRLRGSAMFIERYRDLLKPGGKLISIIDETVLSSNQYDYVRNFIRNNFIIRAIISLHGDAFQMAKARVKTALIYLQKKEYKNEEQPPVFMYSSIYLGVDDLPMTTNPIKVIEARLNAKKEIKEIVNAFKRFEKGETGQWLVPPERVTNRLDVKSCVPLFGRFVDSWKKKGFEVKKLVSLITLREEIIKPKAEYPNEKFKILTITYSGKCKTEEIRYGKDINYSKMKIVRDGDLVFSEYNTFHGAIGYITKKFDGALASGSYTVTRCKNKIESLYLWLSTVV